MLSFVLRPRPESIPLTIILHAYGYRTNATVTKVSQKEAVFTASFECIFEKLSVGCLNCGDCDNAYDVVCEASA